MADEFKANVAEFKELSGLLNMIADSTSRTKSDTDAVSYSMKRIAEIKAEIAKYDIVDPSVTETVNDAVKSLSKAGGQMATLVRLQKEFTQSSNKSNLYWDQLTEKEKKFVKNEEARLRNEKTGIMYKGQMINLGKQEQSMQSKIISGFKGQVSSLKGFAASTAGIQLSLVGIISMIISIRNETNKAAGMAMRAGMQFGGMDKHTKAAGEQIWKMYGGLAMSVDEAGALVQSLSNVGIEGKPQYEMAAIDKLSLMSAAEQAEAIKGLVNEYGLLEDNAMDYNDVIIQLGQAYKESGIKMSISDLNKDWHELLNTGKVYNATTLGTLAIYNTLIRKGEALGFGKSLSVRQDIAKTLGGMSANLSYGWKAKLMEFAGPSWKGKTAPEKILGYEMMGDKPEKQFELMANAIEKFTKGRGQATKVIMTREMLESMGFKKEAGAVMAKSFAGGKFSGENLQSALKEVSKSREDAAKMEQTAADDRKKLIGAAEKVTNTMMSIEEMLSRWVRNVLRPWVTKLITAIQDLMAAIRDWSPFGVSAKKAREDTRMRGTKEEWKKSSGISPEFVEELSKTRQIKSGFEQYKMTGVPKDVLDRYGTEPGLEQ